MTANLTKLLTVAILAVRMVSPAHASVTDVYREWAKAIEPKLTELLGK